MEKAACCVDFSENAKTAFDRAVEIAQKFEAKLHVIHVLPPVFSPLSTDAEWVLPEEPKKSLLLKLEEKMQQEYGSRIDAGIDFEMKILDGHVSSEILRFLEEEDIDLVILGSYGASGMGLVLFGSVAKRIAHRAPCSVMIVR